MPQTSLLTPRFSRARRLAALSAGIGALSLVLTGCGSAATGPGAPATESAGESPFDLSTANLDGRPHIEPVPEAVEALEESGFTPTQSGQLTVAHNGAGEPPISFFAEDDNRTILGSDADMASLVAEGLGLEYAPQNVAWADWPLGVESGKYDLVLSNVGVTEERKEIFDFATYRDAVMGFVVAADSEIEAVDEAADISGLRVIVGSGTNQEQYLLDWIAENEEAGIDPGEPVYYEDSAAGLLALKSGRADAFIMPYPQAAFQTELLGETKVVGKFNSAYPVDGQVGVATAKGNGLAEPVSIVIDHLIETGVYDEVLARWGEEEEAVSESLINPPGLPKP